MGYFNTLEQVTLKLIALNGYFLKQIKILYMSISLFPIANKVGLSRKIFSTLYVSWKVIYPTLTRFKLD